MDMIAPQGWRQPFKPLLLVVNSSLQYLEGQRFALYLAISAAALFIVGFLGPGTGTAWWLVFLLCRDRGKDVIW